MLVRLAMQPRRLLQAAAGCTGAHVAVSTSRRLFGHRPRPVQGARPWLQQQRQHPCYRVALPRVHRLPAAVDSTVVTSDGEPQSLPVSMHHASSTSSTYHPVPAAAGVALYAACLHNTWQCWNTSPPCTGFNTVDPTSCTRMHALSSSQLPPPHPPPPSCTCCLPKVTRGMVPPWRQQQQTPSHPVTTAAGGSVWARQLAGGFTCHSVDSLWGVQWDTHWLHTGYTLVNTPTPLPLT